MRTVRAHAIGIALIVALWSGLGLGMYWDHETQSKQARIETANLANALSEQVNRILREADQLSRLIEWEVQKNGVALPLQQYAQRGVLKLDVFSLVAVVDRDGNLTASTSVWQAVNLRDREYFQVHVANDSDQLFISEPLKGRSQNQTLIRLSHRIDRLDGGFGGIVVISLDAAYFTNFYKELAIGKAGQISIIGTYDRMIRARRNDSGDNSDNRDYLPFDSSIYQAMLAAPGGVVQTQGKYNHRPRLYGYDKLDDYPLTVTVGFSEAEIMAPWIARRDFMVALGLIITLLIAFAEARRVRLLQRLYRTVEAEQVATYAQQQKNDRLNSMFKAIPDGVLIFTDQGIIERGNQVTAQLLGLNAEALERMPTNEFAKLFFRDDQTAERERKIDQLGQMLLNAQNEDTPEYFSVTIERPVLSVFEFHIRYSRTGFSGGVAVIRDVTAQSQLDRMKSDFISTAAHELRTPMAGILGFAELLKAGRITSAQHEDVFSVLHERAKKLNDVLSELLDLARLEARADKDFDYERLNLAHLCRDVVDADPVFATRVSVRLNCHDAWLRGDRLKLILALRNVIENAIKYSPAGSDVELLLQASNNDRNILIQVQDYGIGMNEEERSRAFEKFYRADKSGTVPGTGLGLALVREIIGLHGGQVDLQSQPKLGTTVTIALDIEEANANTPLGAL